MLNTYKDSFLDFFCTISLSDKSIMANHNFIS
nr:MAG TPA: hypothetical protein [Caudoviricetes sp.]